MQRYKVTVEYLGSAFYGFQAQCDAFPTVQGELERAFKRLVGEQNTSRVIASSRTDAGVHAVENVCHVDLRRERQWSKGCASSKPLETLLAHSPNVVQNAINSFLREQNQPIIVRHVEAVSSGFHSRFDACGREYVYHIRMPQVSTRGSHKDHPSFLPTGVFTRDLSWHVPVPLDVDAMAKACRHFLGKHDFTSFRGVKCQASSPVRSLESLTIETIAPSTQDALNAQDLVLLQVHVSAPSFLYHMVRNIVGTLVAVGRHKLQPEDIPRILAGCNRQLAPPMAPAHGLYLTKVKYNLD
ncbi:hypothetical protein AC1031_008932 [Aphanomyces cochlioides]|nr:hypothetical protein AC1031_008932 [Aphanomyces cochlioides]